MPTPPTPSPYDRLPDETAKAFHAFRAYRDMESPRSLRRVSDSLGLKAPRHLKIWAANFHWEARCKAFDDDMEDRKIEWQLAEDRAGYLKKLTDYQRLHEAIGQAGLSFASQYLFIANYLIGPLTEKVKAKKMLTLEELHELEKLRRCRDIGPIADLSSQFMAEALQISRVVKHLEDLKIDDKS